MIYGDLEAAVAVTFLFENLFFVKTFKVQNGMSQRALLWIFCIIIWCKPEYAKNNTMNKTNNANNTNKTIDVKDSFIVEEENIPITHKQLFEQQLSRHGLNDLYSKLDKNGYFWMMKK